MSLTEALAPATVPLAPLSERRGFRLLAPVLSVLVVLLLWSAAVRLWALPSYLLPAPEAVLQRLWSGVFVKGDLWRHIWATLRGMAMGYALGFVLALCLALLFDALPRSERMFSGVVTGLWAMPKVALAPVLLIWLGIGLQAIVVLVAMICMFPIYINMLAGLRTVDGNLLELYRGYGAGRLHIFTHLKAPAALPLAFTGMQIAVAFALVGTSVMEFTVGTAGLGFLIADAANKLDTATSVGAMVLLGVMGASLAMATRALRKRVVFWEKAE